jgi:hypothetical protein
MAFFYKAITEMKNKDMKLKLIDFFLLYILVPIIIIPLFVIKTDRWFALFGILFYFMGLLISKFKQWILLPIPLLFCFWYWYTYGFSPADYVVFYFICMVAGVTLNEIKKSYYRFVNKILPEQMNNLEYDAKIDELNRQIEAYKHQHPGQKVTQEVVEKIRTDIFFE